MALPEPEVAKEWLAAMTLIARFEQRATELYGEGRIGGFLHVASGEEAVAVGGVRALRETDYLVSTYRAHAHALARGTPPGRVMAELLGRVDGTSQGRGGSTHIADVGRRFMGGFGIVAGHVPIAAGLALAARHTEREDVTLCQFGEGALNEGAFGETLNLAALWGLPVVFLVTANRPPHGAVQESAVDLVRRAHGFGVDGLRCDGNDVVDVHRVVSDAVARARSGPHPVLVEAATDRRAEPSALERFAARLAEADLVTDAARATIERDAAARVEAAVTFAEASPAPEAAMLSDHAGPV